MEASRKLLLKAGCVAGVDDIMRATGSEYCYAYKELPLEATSEQIMQYCSTTRRLFAPIARKITPEDNSLWVLRHYLAIKLVTSASILAGSANFAYDRNLLMGVPYFNYYAVLNACRAYLLTSPHVKWDGRKTVEMTHENILNRTADYMRALDPVRRSLWRARLGELRAQRELFSYRFPLSGPDFVGRPSLDPAPVTDFARLIAELASLNTECFQAALKKYASDNIPVPAVSDHAWASLYSLADADVNDTLDRYRFNKYVRGWSTVSTLEVMATDGLMDDLYGSWTHSGDDGDLDVFDPDNYSRLLLAL
ncbi:hypothetical protein JVX98_27080 [Ensifer sp. PDNC004]|uniref:hypothetical protein n=1 Tax=Ensifer sp. PDNC004 TaxID=2811423 RepID=UPI001965F5FB|nr:hypothetical protein [Ensifer sp. PDNC004]QRY67965.1 hypothetical protein JVX98_27080 [Ensifer sp. PDNC004]